MQVNKLNSSGHGCAELNSYIFLCPESNEAG